MEPYPSQEPQAQEPSDAPPAAGGEPAQPPPAQSETPGAQPTPIPYAPPGGYAPPAGQSAPGWGPYAAPPSAYPPPGRGQYASPSGQYPPAGQPWAPSGGYPPYGPPPYGYGPPPGGMVPPPRKLSAGRLALFVGLAVLAATLVVGSAAALLVATIGRGLQANGSSSPAQLTNSNPMPPGKVAPDFRLPAEQGGYVTLSQYLGGHGRGDGKVVVLEFFAPWCPHCRAEVDTLDTVARVFSGQVQVLSVSATPYGFNYENTGDTSPITMADMQKFVNQFHVIYPALLDTLLRVGNAYGVYGYPQIYVIDRNGVITWNNGQGGETSYIDLQIQIDKALAVPASPST